MRTEILFCQSEPLYTRSFTRIGQAPNWPTPMLLSTEFPEWLQSLKCRKEHVRLITSFWWD